MLKVLMLVEQLSVCLLLLNKFKLGLVQANLQALYGLLKAIARCLVPLELCYFGAGFVLSKSRVQGL